MKGNAYIYILAMALVSYLIRVLPLTLIRREIKSRFLKSFLYYVPYVTLSVMTFPAILYATGSMISAAAGLIAAVVIAFRGRGLLTVAVGACLAVFIVEVLLTFVSAL